MKLRCLNIFTSDFERMKEFYSLLLNTESVDRGDSRSEFSVDNVCVVIMKSDGAQKFIPDNFGLEFECEDIDSEYARIAGQGIAPEKEPVTLPWGWRYFNVKDPDGNNVDFVQYVG